MGFPSGLRDLERYTPTRPKVLYGKEGCIRRNNVFENFSTPWKPRPLPSEDTPAYPLFEPPLSLLRPTPRSGLASGLTPDPGTSTSSRSRSLNPDDPTKPFVSLVVDSVQDETRTTRHPVVALFLGLSFSAPVYYSTQSSVTETPQGPCKSSVDLWIHVSSRLFSLSQLRERSPATPRRRPHTRHFFIPVETHIFLGRPQHSFYLVSLSDLRPSSTTLCKLI